MNKASQKAFICGGAGQYYGLVLDACGLPFLFRHGRKIGQRKLLVWKERLAAAVSKHEVTLLGRCQVRCEVVGRITLFGRWTSEEKLRFLERCTCAIVNGSTFLNSLALETLPPVSHYLAYLLQLYHLIPRMKYLSGIDGRNTHTSSTQFDTHMRSNNQICGLRTQLPLTYDPTEQRPSPSALGGSLQFATYHKSCPSEGPLIRSRRQRK